MRQLGERWLCGPLWVRCATLLVAASVMLLLAWQLISVPQQTQQRQLAAQNRQIQDNAAALVHKSLALQDRTQAEANLAKLAQLTPERPFSVMAFVKQAGGKRVKWLPEERQGELHILLGWETLPALFLLLSRYPAVSLSSFTLVPQGSLLQLSLMLEFSDET